MFLFQLCDFFRGWGLLGCGEAATQEFCLFIAAALFSDKCNHCLVARTFLFPNHGFKKKSLFQSNFFAIYTKIFVRFESLFDS